MFRREQDYLLQKIRLEEDIRLLRSTRWTNEADEEAQMVRLQEIVEKELENRHN